MSWDLVVGQQEAVRRLEAAVTAPVHAYLFVGPGGAGKRRAATVFAGELLSAADPDNAELAAYAKDIARWREAGLPTVPAKLGRELKTNPFLRADDPDMEARWGGGGDAVATFAALRAAKDNF